MAETELPFSQVLGDFVYPRLPRPAAMALIAEMHSLSLEELAARSDLDHPDAAPAPTGTQVGTKILKDVRDAVREAAHERGFPDRLPKGREWTFDSVVGRILYERMRIIPADAGSEGVWSFLTLVVVPEIGPWRFPNRPDERLLGRPRNVLRRSWWRAHILGPDLDCAPDGQDPLGEDELVGIMERASLAGNPRIARAVRDGIFRGAGRVPLGRTDFARDLTKRVLRLMPLVALDAYPDEALATLIDDMIEQSVKALAEQS